MARIMDPSSLDRLIDAEQNGEVIGSYRRSAEAHPARSHAAPDTPDRPGARP